MILGAWLRWHTLVRISHRHKPDSLPWSEGEWGIGPQNADMNFFVHQTQVWFRAHRHRQTKRWMDVAEAKDRGGGKMWWGAQDDYGSICGERQAVIGMEDAWDWVVWWAEFYPLKSIYQSPNFMCWYPQSWLPHLHCLHEAVSIPRFDLFLYLSPKGPPKLLFMVGAQQVLVLYWPGIGSLVVSHLLWFFCKVMLEDSEWINPVNKTEALKAPTGPYPARIFKFGPPFLHWKGVKNNPSHTQFWPCGSDFWSGAGRVELCGSLVACGPALWKLQPGHWQHVPDLTWVPPWSIPSQSI